MIFGLGILRLDEREKHVISHDITPSQGKPKKDYSRAQRSWDSQGLHAQLDEGLGIKGLIESYVSAI